MEFGGENRGICKAEVLQFKTCSLEMMLVDLVAVAKGRQHNHGASRKTTLLTT